MWEYMWWKAKIKKIEFSVDLPSVATIALGKTGHKTVSGPRFAECYGHGTRRNWALGRVLEPWHSAKIFWKKNKNFFCRVPAMSPLGEDFFFKKKGKLCRVPATSPLGKGAVRWAFPLTVTFQCRVLTWHSAKALPSAWYIALGKEPFVDKSYAGGSLQSVTLGKLFAECKLGFVECLGHSAKNPCPVVPVLALVC